MNAIVQPEVLIPAMNGINVSAARSVSGKQVRSALCNLRNSSIRSGVSLTHCIPCFASTIRNRLSMRWRARKNREVLEAAPGLDLDDATQHHRLEREYDVIAVIIALAVLGTSREHAQLIADKTLQ